MLRRLKIAWTVFSAALTVALCVLWVRSYRSADFIGWTFPGGLRLTINSEVGRLGFARRSVQVAAQMRQGFSSRAIGPESAQMMQQLYRQQETVWGFGGTSGFHVPHWFAAIFFAALAAVPWLPWNFSLRTMLIVITLVAVVLGLVVWPNR